VYTAAETPNACQWAGEPPKWPLLVGDLDPIQYVAPWTHAIQPSNCILISSAGLQTHERDQQTDTHRQTDQATPSVAIGHIQHFSTAMSEMWPKTKYICVVAGS